VVAVGSATQGRRGDLAAVQVAAVVDVELLPQHGRVVLVVLQDGRQLEGELMVMSGRYEVAGVVFDAWEIEELEDLT
jgi:hypothetical protein